MSSPIFMLNYNLFWSQNDCKGVVLIPSFKSSLIQLCLKVEHMDQLSVVVLAFLCCACTSHCKSKINNNELLLSKMACFQPFPISSIVAFRWNRLWRSGGDKEEEEKADGYRRRPKAIEKFVKIWWHKQSVSSYCTHAWGAEKHIEITKKHCSCQHTARNDCPECFFSCLAFLFLSLKPPSPSILSSHAWLPARCEERHIWI